MMSANDQAVILSPSRPHNIRVLAVAPRLCYTPGVAEKRTWLVGNAETVVGRDAVVLRDEIQHQAPTYTTGFEAAMCVSGLIGGENISDAQRQNALLDLPD